MSDSVLFLERLISEQGTTRYSPAKLNRLDDPLRDVFLCIEPASIAIAVQGERKESQVIWKAPVYGVPIAGCFVDKDRTEKRERLQSVERIRRDQNRAISPLFEGPKPIPTGSIACGYFHIGGIPISWGLPCRANLVNDYLRNT